MIKLNSVVLCSLLWASAGSLHAQDWSQDDAASDGMSTELDATVSDRLVAVTPPHCRTGIQTYNGYGLYCPRDYYAVAQSLCQLGGFVGAELISRSCSPIPGGSAATYSVAYRCLRPQPCTPN